MNAKSRIIGIALSTLFIASSALSAPTAIVEDINFVRPGLQVMDFLEPGTGVRLQDNEKLILSYTTSCIRERISGGTVTIGERESRVIGGKRIKELVECDSKSLSLVLSPNNNSAAGLVIRNGPRAAELPKPDLILFGTAPLVRTDDSHQNITVEKLGSDASTVIVKSSGRLTDFAISNMYLEPGGLYRFRAGRVNLVVMISPKATPNASLLSRLVPM